MKFELGVRGRGAAVARVGAAARRHVAGVTFVEVMLATAILLLTSLSLAFAFSSTSLASRNSERAVAARASLESVAASVANVPFPQLLSWNGVKVDRGDHTIEITTSLSQVGLIAVELRAVDDRTGVELSRIATFRAPET
jgi:hypothetical protein